MMDEQAIRSAFEAAGQGQVFQFWDTLDSGQRHSLLEQAASIDLEEVNELIESHLRGTGGATPDFDTLKPAPYIPLPDNGGKAEEWEAAARAGEEALRAGRVAAFTVAGGQGTRLGYDGPKGTFPVTPVREKTLFQVFAEKIRAAEADCGTEIPWFLMTSRINDTATRDFFRKNAFFGLRPEQVTIFTQGLMPAVDPEGKILLEDRDRIAMSPDGHGGSLRALVRSGAVDRMRESGRDIVSYFQVDNPLVRAIDPAFIGFHVTRESEMTSKMVPKAYPEEKVGVFCRQNGKTVVVEYSDLPEALMQARDDDGALRFAAGSIAIHILDREFIHKIGSGEDPACRLPFHQARKKIPTVDARGNPVQPEEPNGVKFEMFVFDALPTARNPVIVECRREDEFAPVKNAEGSDSPQTCREAQLRKATRWLAAAGVSIDTDADGLPAISIEISPRFADSGATFVHKWRQLDPVPELTDGLVLE